MTASDAPTAPLRFRLRLANTDITHNLTDDKLVIGSHVAVDVCIKDRVASRRHAEVYVDDGRVVVRDLKSKNGTWCKNRPVKMVVLDAGGSFRIGETDFFIEPIDNADGSFLEDDIQTEREAFKRPPLVDPPAEKTEAESPPVNAPPPYSVAKAEFQRAYVRRALGAARFDETRAAQIAALPVETFARLRQRVGLGAQDEEELEEDAAKTSADDSE